MASKYNHELQSTLSFGNNLSEAIPTHKLTITIRGFKQ